MLELLKQIVESLSNAFHFLTSSIVHLGQLLLAVPRFVTYLTTLVATAVPTEIAVFVLAAVGIYFVLLILGRN